MDNPSGLSNIIGYISVFEAMLRIMTYIAVISVSFKVIQALNVYINKNSR